MFESRRKLFVLLTRKLKNTILPELAVLLGRWFPIELFSKPENGRERVFTPWRTLILFIYQILAGNLSCDAVVQKAIVWLEMSTKQKISPNTSAYSQARKRLPSDILFDFNDHLKRCIPVSATFHDRVVKVVDGTGLSMADTPENQKISPLPKKNSSGFPTLKLLTVFSLAIGTIIDWGMGPGSTSDLSLFRSLWPSLQPGDFILGDRGFCSYADFYYLKQRGIEILTRKHAWRKLQRTIKCLGQNDLIVEWFKGSKPLDWMTHEEWKQLPKCLKIREISFKINIRGFRTKQVTIVTTLLDETIPASDFAELYRKRWCAELFLRDIKISMGMDVLKCKTPDMVEKEVHVFIMAYNLIRLIMLEVADERFLSPHALSFTATIVAIKEWGPQFAGAKTMEDFEFLFEQFSRVVAHRRLRNRRNRIEPRALKRRKKKYEMLRGDRHQFKEISHCFGRRKHA